MNDSAEVWGSAGERRVATQLLPRQRVTGLGMSLMLTAACEEGSEGSQRPSSARYYGNSPLSS